MSEILNYLAANWMSILGLLISVFAFIISRKAAIKSSRIESSSKLSEIQQKIRPGRAMMRDIFQEWSKTYSKEIGSEALLESEKEKESFVSFYNKNYHSQPHDQRKRLMSNEIHTYLHELHHLWDRHLNNEFSEIEIKKRFAPSIKMDTDLLLIYLEAHWKEHNELLREKRNRFWYHIPTIVEIAKKWED